MIRSRLGVAVAAVLSLAACAHSSADHPTTAALAKRYLAIATPANKTLDKYFDALSDRAHDGDGVGASVPLLQTIASTERAFDHDLLALRLPSQLSGVAAALVTANEARADLTAQAMTATSVASLTRYESELDAMNGPVEAQVRILRTDLGLPPPDTD